MPPPPTLLLVSAFCAADGEAPLACAGNPAGVVLLGAGAAWPPTPSLSSLANLLALPATVFLLPAPASEAAAAVPAPAAAAAYHTRYSTGGGAELPLCGHASLAGSAPPHHGQRARCDDDDGGMTKQGGGRI